jgi:hypothetical protein
LKVYVLDASVAVRFLLAEDLSEKAELVLEDFLKGSWICYRRNCSPMRLETSYGRALKRIYRLK